MTLTILCGTKTVTIHSPKSNAQHGEQPQCDPEVLMAPMPMWVQGLNHCAGGGVMAGHGN
jgi:hypothetical protein